MKKFIAKIVLFTALTVTAMVLFGRLEIGKATGDSAYMKAIIDKHQRLDSLPSPRLVLVGGSNLSFGTDSEKIEEELGFPVVNLGMHAGLGLNFILNEMEYNFREGDIVVLAIEYFLGHGDDRLKKHTADVYPDAARYFDTGWIGKINFLIYDKFKMNFNKVMYHDSDNFVYNRHAFNKYGDMVGHLDRPKPAELYGKTELHYRYYEGIDLLNAFYEAAKAKNVTVYWTFPNFRQSDYEHNRLIIDRYREDLEKDMVIPMISQPDDFVYHDSLFYDTNYHLIREGRARRTDKLIALLKEQLALDGIPANGRISAQPVSEVGMK